MMPRLFTTLASCAFGALGGAFFDWLGAPMPWMLGAMLCSAAAAILGARPGVPASLRNIGLATLGVAVGAAWTPETMSNIGSWLASFSLVFGYTVLGGTICTLYLRRIAGFDPATAFFAAMPGGMNEMVIVGERYGADSRRVALTHAVRVLVVVSLIALAYRLFAGYTRPTEALSIEMAPKDIAILIAIGVASVALALRTHFPAPYFLGPLMGSLVLHATGVTDAAPSDLISVIGQVVVGTALGSRFSGTTFAEMTGTALHGLLAAILQILITLAFAFGIGAALQMNGSDLVLALAPAGIAEMSLIALAVGVDVAFVAVHQLVRVILVFFLAGRIFATSSKKASLE